MRRRAGTKGTGCSSEDEQLLGLVLRFAALVQKDLGACTQEIGLTHSQAVALQRLDRPLSMRALAECLHCDASNVTIIVDRLEALGYVRREVLETDRRVRTLVVTSSGKRVRKRLLGRLGRPEALLSRLSARERKQLARLLEALCDEPG